MNKRITTMRKLRKGLSGETLDMISKVRAVAESRKRQSEMEYEGKASKFKDLIKEIRSHRAELQELSEVVNELLDNGIIDGNSDLISSSENECPALAGHCFGIAGCLSGMNDKLHEIARYEDSLFYDFDNDKFFICTGSKEVDVAAGCNEDWLIRQCVRLKPVAHSLAKISLGFDEYRKKVVKFVRSLK